MAEDLDNASGANAMADPISRVNWPEFYRLCAQVGVHPKRLRVCLCRGYVQCREMNEASLFQKEENSVLFDSVVFRECAVPYST